MATIGSSRTGNRRSKLITSIIVNASLAFSIGLFLSACAGTEHIGQGTVDNPALRIVGDDFELRGGQMFKTPFESNLLDPAPPGNQVVNSYRDALKDRAKKVRVYTGDSSEALYGVLALFPRNTDDDCRGPGVTSYLINIPEDKLRAARQGGISVAYEVAPCANNRSQYTWVIWIASSPLN